MMKKRAAHRLASLLLAGTLAVNLLALPAGAAADAAYTAELQRATADWATQRVAMPGLIQKYPNSPEPYALCAEVYWNELLREEDHLDLQKTQQMIAYCDKAIALGTQAEHPAQQALWDDCDKVNPDGEEVDYTALSALIKTELQEFTLGQQDAAIQSMRQYLDLKERWAAIQEKDADTNAAQKKKRLLAEGYSAAEAAEQAQWYKESQLGICEDVRNELVPQMRAELQLIEVWNASGTNSFAVGLCSKKGQAGNFLQITAGKGDTTMLFNEFHAGQQPGITQITTSQPLQGVQRGLDTMTIFVPAGTQVDLSGSAVIEDWSVTSNIGHYTAALGIPHTLCSSVWAYNGLPYSVYVVGV